MGRFIAEDTYEGDVTNPLSLNLYTYVENNPLTNVDPSGHMMQSDNILPREKLNQIKVISKGYDNLQGQLKGLDNSRESSLKRITILTLQSMLHNAAQNIRFNYFQSIVNPTQKEMSAAYNAGYIFGKNVDLGAGYRARVDSQNDGTGTKRHGHIFGPKGEEWSRDVDGEIHDKHRNSPGSPPKWVQKEMEKKLRFKWKEAKQNPSTSSIDTGEVKTGIYVIGGGYLLYRGIRLIPSLVPFLWPTLPANVLAP
ncbi:hypothetical protein D3C86_1052390 [compost metagenome]